MTQCSNDDRRALNREQVRRRRRRARQLAQQLAAPFGERNAHQRRRRRIEQTQEDLVLGAIGDETRASIGRQRNEAVCSVINRLAWVKTKLGCENQDSASSVLFFTSSGIETSHKNATCSARGTGIYLCISKKIMYTHFRTLSTTNKLRTTFLKTTTTLSPFDETTAESTGTGCVQACSFEFLAFSECAYS
jgi:hypothetical protein